MLNHIPLICLYIQMCSIALSNGAYTHYCNSITVFFLQDSQ